MMVTAWTIRSLTMIYSQIHTCNLSNGSVFDLLQPLSGSYLKLRSLTLTCKSQLTLSLDRSCPNSYLKSTYIWIQVLIKDFFINSIRKNFVPFWIDSDVDIENDPYTTDCSDQTNASNPHAYTQFTITNGKLSSRNCIEKPPGNLFWKNNDPIVFNI